MLVIALLNGCGYQLRGSTSLPGVMSPTYIQGLSPYSELVDDFAYALRSRNATVTTDQTEASAVLKITGNDSERLVLSVDVTGKVLEYELRQTIRFSVLGPDRSELLPEQSITLSRAFLFTSTGVLARVREARLIKRTLQENLVDLAMLRIASIKQE